MSDENAARLSWMIGAVVTVDVVSAGYGVADIVDALDGAADVANVVDAAGVVDVVGVADTGSTGAGQVHFGSSAAGISDDFYQESVYWSPTDNHYFGEKTWRVMEPD